MTVNAPRARGRGRLLLFAALVAALALAAFAYQRWSSPDDEVDVVGSMITGWQNRNSLTVFSAQVATVTTRTRERFGGLATNRQTTIVPATVEYRLDQRLLTPDWLQQPQMFGYACYTERFAGDLKGVAKHLDHLEDLGVTYLHLMPLLLPRDGDHDGGYAVQDYRAVRPDLGTVEDRVRESLDATGVLGSAVLWFETDDDGEFLPPSSWRAATLATVTTHDLPTAAGFLAEEQVRVRDELGQLGVPVEQERATVRRQRAALLALLEREGLLAQCDGDVPLAMHAALVAAPSTLVLAAFGDAVGDLRQPNLPGTVDEYPNWRLPVADGTGRPLGVEELLEHPGVRRLTALLAQGVRSSSSPVR